MPASRTPSPAPIDDPTARWEAIRAQWLRPSPAVLADNGDEARSPAQQRRKDRDSVFQQRITTLGELLREANAAATSSSAPPPPPPHLGSSLAPSTAALLAPALQRADDGGSGAGSSGGSRLSKGKERGLVDEETLDEQLPDGGMPIRDSGANGGQGDPVHELKKVSEVRPLLSPARPPRAHPDLDDGATGHLPRLQAGPRPEGTPTALPRRASPFSLTTQTSER